MGFFSCVMSFHPFHPCYSVLGVWVVCFFFFCICCNIAAHKTEGQIKFSVSIATQIDGTASNFLKNVPAGTPKLNLKMACAVNYQCPVLGAIEASRLSRQRWNLEFQI